MCFFSLVWKVVQEYFFHYQNFSFKEFLASKSVYLIQHLHATLIDVGKASSETIKTDCLA